MNIWIELYTDNIFSYNQLQWYRNRAKQSEPMSTVPLFRYGNEAEARHRGPYSSYLSPGGCKKPGQGVTARWYIGGLRLECPRYIGYVSADRVLNTCYTAALATEKGHVTWSPRASLSIFGHSIFTESLDLQAAGFFFIYTIHVQLFHLLEVIASWENMDGMKVYNFLIFNWNLQHKNVYI